MLLKYFYSFTLRRDYIYTFVYFSNSQFKLNKNNKYIYYYSTDSNNNFNNDKNKTIEFLPIVTYDNADTDKIKILNDNKDKAGIYMWKHNESKNTYIGSAININKRMKNYYSINHLENNKTMYICNALREHGYSTFSLYILEYIDINNLSKAESKLRILEKEQHFLDNFLPKYNILKIAGSRLGSLHLESTIKKMREAKKGNSHSLETRELMSEAKKGIAKTEEHKTRISEVLGTTIYVYSSDGITLINTFSSARKAVKFLRCSHPTILTYTRNGKLFKGKWILSTFLK